jgi:hypothetical protein
MSEFQLCCFLGCIKVRCGFRRHLASLGADEDMPPLQARCFLSNAKQVCTVSIAPSTIFCLVQKSRLESSADAEYVPVMGLSCMLVCDRVGVRKKH